MHVMTGGAKIVNVAVPSAHTVSPRSVITGPRAVITSRGAKITGRHTTAGSQRTRIAGPRIRVTNRGAKIAGRRIMAAAVAREEDDKPRNSLFGNRPDSLATPVRLLVERPCV